MIFNNSFIRRYFAEVHINELKRFTLLLRNHTCKAVTPVRYICVIREWSQPFNVALRMNFYRVQNALASCVLFVMGVPLLVTHPLGRLVECVSKEGLL